MKIEKLIKHHSLEAMVFFVLCAITGSILVALLVEVVALGFGKVVGTVAKPE